MLQRFQVQDGKLAPAPEGAAPVLVYCAPDEVERKYLVDTLKLDEHTLNSALDPDEVSRLEFEPEHVAIVFKRPKTYTAQDNFVFKVLSTGFFLFRKRLVVVAPENYPLFNGRSMPPSATVADVMLRLLSATV